MQNIGRKRVYSMDMTYIEQRQMIVSIDNLSELIAILERTEEARNRRSSSRNTLDNRLIDLYGRGSVSSKSNISR
jgi:hypothetical protein